MKQLDAMNTSATKINAQLSKERTASAQRLQEKKLKRRESMELRESQKFAKGTGELQLTQSSNAERPNAGNGLSVPESNDGDVRASAHSERSARKSELSSVEDVASFAENQPTMDQDALMGHYKAAQAMGSYVSAAHGN